MKIQIFTIFPKMLEDFLKYGLISTACEKGVLNVDAINIRDFTEGSYASVDDTPYGGGPGMVLSPEPIFKAVEETKPHRPLCLLSPGGRKLDQKLLVELAELEGFSLICGRYEGVDARVVEELVDDELSLGDFILQGGEVAAMAILEGVGRLLEGALGNQESIRSESFSDGLLEYPQYTRPENYKGMEVPQVLRSGNHAEIEKWRRVQALAKTQKVRPDLISARGGLTPEEMELLGDFELDTNAIPNTDQESDATE